MDPLSLNDFPALVSKAKEGSRGYYRTVIIIISYQNGVCVLSKQERPFTLLWWLSRHQNMKLFFCVSMYKRLVAFVV